MCIFDHVNYQMNLMDMFGDIQQLEQLDLEGNSLTKHSDTNTHTQTALLVLLLGMFLRCFGALKWLKFSRDETLWLQTR